MEGTARYLCDGEEFIVSPGMVLLCHPGKTDHFIWDTTRTTRHAYLHFQLEGTLPSTWPPQVAWPLVRGQLPLLSALFEQLTRTRDPGQTQIFAQALLTGFLCAESPPLYPEPVTRALEAIKQAVERGQSLSLERLAEAAFVTPEYLCRIFKRHLGMTLMDFVWKERLQRAAQLLERTNYSVAEVAQLSGFASPFHFSRRFRQHSGLSPRHYRERG